MKKKDMQFNDVDGLDYVVLSEDIVNCDCVSENRVAVFAYLYYSDEVEECSYYLDSLPQNIDLYIVTPNKDIEKALQKLVHKRFAIIYKENRGRDMSGLLVAASKYILDYEIICFIHDKKPKKNDVISEAESWKQSLWMCSLGHRNFVENVVSYMIKHPEVGIMVPPPPISKRTDVWMSTGWSGDYEKALDIKKRIELDVELDEDGILVTYGNVFWARVSAIRKLLDYAWSYEDFDPEPLADDGTISHAIERLYGYVAKDAGYKSHILLNSAYMHSYIEQLLNGARDIRADKDELEQCYKKVYRNYSLLSYNQYILKDLLYCYSGITDFETIVKKRDDVFRMIELCKSKTYIYIWGDLEKCVRANAILKHFQICVSGFKILDVDIQTDEICQISVITNDEVFYRNDDVLIVVCAREGEIEAIHNGLGDLNYTDFVIE